MRTGWRLVRVLAAVVALALSVGWLLRRRVGQPGCAPADPLAPAAAPVQPPAPGPAEVEVTPVEVAAVEVAPVQVAPVEATPVEVTLVDAAPVEVTPVDAAPVVVADDDLRRIRGIGPAIERSLHGLGIRTYQQLATLDDAGLDRVRDLLHDFRGRVDREDWVGQARELHREKYGELPG